MANRMTDLLNKIERRLGTAQLDLPDNLKKDKWAENVIANETLDTFSRYFPNIMPIVLDLSNRRVDGWYVIDDKITDNIEILGVRDIDWEVFSNQALGFAQGQGYGIYDFMTNQYGLDDVAMLQMRADHMSLYNYSIFVKFKPPNMVRLDNVVGTDLTRGMRSFPIVLFIKHAPNLMTIEPTKMETFEALAQADVASYLYENLKYYDGLQTVFANVDLKLSDLESKASKRDEVIEALKDGYISASNKNQPIMFTV